MMKRKRRERLGAGPSSKMEKGLGREQIWGSFPSQIRPVG